MGFWRFVRGYVKLNLSTAMEYRWNFIFQSFFMIMNNTFFVLFWYFLFQNIDSLAGWDLAGLSVLFAVAALGYGLMSFFCGNWLRVNEIIYEGKLDFYLSLPKDELTHVLISKSSFSGFGDMVFGIVVFLVFNPLAGLPLMVLYSILGAAIWASLIILLSNLSFVYGNTDGVTHMGMNLLFAFTTYPYSIFSNTIRIVFFFIIPAFFIGNVPVMLLHSFSWSYFCLLVFFAMLLPLFAWWTFKLGIKRYESGNLLNVRI